VGVGSWESPGGGVGETHLRCMYGDDSDMMNDMYADATRTMMRRMMVGYIGCLRRRETVKSRLDRSSAVG
jgi:hypothetical protein